MDSKFVRVKFWIADCCDRFTSCRGDLPRLPGEPASAGRVSFAPASFTFLAIENANNSNCQGGF